jgi:hypothetical protein
VSASAIEFQDVRKSFGLAFSLGPLTLSVPRGSIYALIGPNGAGKSTALNMLMGMGEPEFGAIKVLDRDVRLDEVEIKRRTAFVSPDMDYRAWGTVGRAIDFVRGFYPDWNAERCEQLQFSFGVHRDTRVDADDGLVVTFALLTIASQVFPVARNLLTSRNKLLSYWLPLFQRLWVPFYLVLMAAGWSQAYGRFSWFRWPLQAGGVVLCIAGYVVLVQQLRSGIRPSSNGNEFSPG